jgi:hypothetical protein
MNAAVHPQPSPHPSKMEPTIVNQWTSFYAIMSVGSWKYLMERSVFGANK